MEWLTLEGGAQVFIDNPAKKGICKSCKTEFTWGTTKGNRWMPIVWVDGKAVSHFSNCPGAGKHRRDNNGQLA